MKNISAWAIRHPVTPVVLFVVLFFMGVVAFIRLPHQPQPGHLLPRRHVIVSQPGAAPHGDRDADHAEGRRRGREHRQRQATSPRWPSRGSRASSSSSRSARRSTARSPTCAMPSPRCAATCPRASRSPRSAHGRRGGAIAYLRGQHHARMTEEELSWFVDNTISKRLLGVAGRRAGSARRRRRAARSAWSSTRRACRRSASPPWR